ncbi:MAG: DUF2268 domain-containing protein, partial [Rikenellaceae bacterium]|nr:DUF2268 domain-containing protein [Rikenellaceae bacterium]
MKTLLKYASAAALVLCLLPTAVRAQYYDQGTAPASIKWNYVETPYNKIIFPEDYLPQAARVMHYLDTVRIAVGHGYRVGTMRTPVVIQTHNYNSNGLVMRAPTRMELIVTPPSHMSPEPWLKQLVTHEARHTVQYNLMNRHFIKFVSYLLGDQGSLLGVALFPLWAMEGDAVLAETELSTFGRGWQPSFTIEYRAMLDQQRWQRFAVDKWFCGSYRDMMPDHYQWGYQVTSYTWTKYNENVWDRVGDYASRYPFLIFTTKIAMHKYYGTSVNRLSRETLDDLHDYWTSLPARANSTTIVPTPITSYTTYSNPAAMGSTLVALKKDLDRPERIVSVDLTTGREKVLMNTGFVNSPLVVEGREAVWSELRRSKFYEQKVNSVIRRANLETGKRGTVRGERQALFPTLLYGDKIVYVRYEYDGSYTLRVVGEEEPAWHFPLPVSIHGVAADSKTQSVYLIAVNEGGMSIIKWVDNGGKPYIRNLKPASYATLSNLKAHAGKLYFTSTQSGRDEGHMIDLETGIETRHTESRYGSFSPSPLDYGNSEAKPSSLIVTTYTHDG